MSFMRRGVGTAREGREACRTLAAPVSQRFGRRVAATRPNRAAGPRLAWRAHAHLAAPRARPARAAARRAGARAARAGFALLCARGGHRVPGVPDLSQLRLRLLADLGPGAAGRRTCRASTPTARRPSIRWPSRSARCSRRWATRRRGPGWRDAVVVLPAGRRRLPPGPRGVHAVGRARRRAAGPQPPRLRRSWPRAATSTSRTWRWSPGPRRWRPRGRAAAAPSGSCSPAPACCAPRPGSCSAPTGSGWRLARAAVGASASGRGADRRDRARCCGR